MWLWNLWNRKGHKDEHGQYHPDIFISDRYRDRSFLKKNRTFTKEEVQLMLKVKRASEEEWGDDVAFKTKKIHHGHCHGCWTQEHAPEMCKLCYCHDLDANPNNWSSGVDCHVGKESRETTEILDILKSQNFKEQYPEYFL